MPGSDASLPPPASCKYIGKPAGKFIVEHGSKILYNHQSILSSIHPFI